MQCSDCPYNTLIKRNTGVCSVRTLSIVLSWSKFWCCVRIVPTIPSGEDSGVPSSICPYNTFSGAWVCAAFSLRPQQLKRCTAVCNSVYPLTPVKWSGGLTTLVIRQMSRKPKISWRHPLYSEQNCKTPHSGRQWEA